MRLSRYNRRRNIDEWPYSLVAACKRLYIEGTWSLEEFERHVEREIRDEGKTPGERRDEVAAKWVNSFSGVRVG